jgi:hypothetical protein
MGVANEQPRDVPTAVVLVQKHQQGFLIIKILSEGEGMTRTKFL